MDCPCDVPQLIACWKRGYRDGHCSHARRALRRPKPGEREAYELGYREGAIRALIR